MWLLSVTRTRNVAINGANVVALALAAAKRLFIEHANLKRGEFNQRSANRTLREKAHHFRGH